ncbi:hypothetical protein [Pyrobaculum aerophilum]|uniref:hypothetical protein n=1 Tax=Pyrobaculum aerophilum TaxID=13773 RepID=UPI002FD9E9B4
MVEEYVKRPQPKPGDAAHVGLGSGGVGRGPSCPSGHGRRSPPLELVRVKTEEKLRRRCLGPQMKTSARHPERYGYAEPWISAVLRLPDCQHQPMRRAVETPHAATNVASAAHVLARRVESLSPASSEAASQRGAGGAKTSPHAPN